MSKQKKQPPKSAEEKAQASKGKASKSKRGRRRKGMCLEDRPLLEPNAGGIDIGAREIFVAVPDRRHRTRGRGVPAHRRTHQPHEQDCSRRPNHQGIPATASSAGDPPLERNPSSFPPRFSKGIIASMGFSHSLGQKLT